MRVPELKWEEWVDLLGKAHEVVGRFDELICLFSRRSFSFLKKDELRVPHAHPTLLRLAERHAHKPFTLALLKKMHRALKPVKDVGRFRKRQNWIGPEGGSIEEAYYLPPKFERVPALMDNLKKYLNSKEKDPLIQLAIFVAQLLIIHPFMDGNGRIARALIPMILCKKKMTRAPLFFMSAYFHRHRLQYFEKLFQISKNNDWEGWIRFFLKGIIEDGEYQIKKMSSTKYRAQSY